MENVESWDIKRGRRRSIAQREGRSIWGSGASTAGTATKGVAQAVTLVVVLSHAHQKSANEERESKARPYVSPSDDTRHRANN